MPVDPSIERQIMDYLRTVPFGDTAYKIARHYYETTYPREEPRFKAALDELVREGKLISISPGWYKLP